MAEPYHEIRYVLVERRWFPPDYRPAPCDMEWDFATFEEAIATAKEFNARGQLYPGERCVLKMELTEIPL